jgi:hypothetical protein
MTCVSRVAVVLGCCALAPAARADEAYEQAPIHYLSATAKDPVARLQNRLDRGELKLDHNSQNDYLASLLRHLNIPVSSQGLVFSKTSFQRDRISPSNPRALYFDDDTYVGWVPGGDVVEIASTDPDLGTVFYTLDQKSGAVSKTGSDKTSEKTSEKSAPPRIVRQTHTCLQCHGSTLTRDVPGLLIRSVYPDADGQPVLSAGTFLTTQQSPFAERWGGWYVTGRHGLQRHMGNVTVGDGAVREGQGGGGGASPETLLDVEAGANVVDLSKKFDASAYLAGTSDMVALMVFTHQAQTHNLMTRANYQTRVALRDEEAMNEALGRGTGAPAAHSESTLNRIKDAGEPLVRQMLFCDEAALGKVEGAGEFDRDFQARGPRDGKGRSLRELDLKRRLFRYPCSYLIYSAQFDALPGPVKEYVYRRLWDVLSGADASADFSHLTDRTRRAIVEILLDTKPDLPPYWKKPAE